MKNCKPFPSPAWWDDTLLGIEQRTAWQRASPGRARLALVDLTKLAADLEREGPAVLAACLEPWEVAHLHDLRLPQRRLQWLGGRLAAKEAARRLLPGDDLPAFADLRVEAEPSGIPRLHCARCPAAAGIRISISHSGGHAGALAMEGGHCGLDLQRLSAKILKVRERFTVASECALLDNCPCLAGLPAMERFTLLWAAKESCRKAIPCTPLLGFLEMRLTGLTTGEGGWVLAQLTGRGGASLPPIRMALLADVYAIALTANLST